MIPVGKVADATDRNDAVLLAPALDQAAQRGLLLDIETIWLDPGSDSEITRERLADRGLDDAIIVKRRRPGSKEPKRNQPMGLRSPVERTNLWLSNFSQLRPNTDP